MSPRHITALAAVSILAAGGVTAAAITADDDHTRTIAITSQDTSLDDLIAKNDKVAFDLRGRDATLRGHLERSASGLITGRIEVRK